MDFNTLVEKLEYFYVEKSSSKVSSEVADEIRDFIRSNGWQCLDEFEDVEEWSDDNGIDTTGFEWVSVANVDIFCANRYCIEHDADWRTFNISFYGIWGKEGVFEVVDV